MSATLLAIRLFNQTRYFGSAVTQKFLSGCTAEHHIHQLVKAVRVLTWRASWLFCLVAVGADLISCFRAVRSITISITSWIRADCSARPDSASDEAALDVRSRITLSLTRHEIRPPVLLDSMISLFFLVCTNKNAPPFPQIELICFATIDNRRFGPKNAKTNLCPFSVGFDPISLMLSSFCKMLNCVNDDKILPLSSESDSDSIANDLNFDNRHETLCRKTNWLILDTRSYISL